MKKLKAKHLSASEAGDYFQVLFAEDRDSLTNYLLIQRGFEFDEERHDPPYIESDDERFCGRVELKIIEFNRNRFYIQLADEEKADLEIEFSISENDYQEVKRVLQIILSGCDFAKID